MEGSSTSSIPDVQMSRPIHAIPIDRVEVKGVHRRVCIEGSRGSICLDARIDLSIDLPRDLRGVHVSRNIEAALEVFNVIECKSFTTLEEAVELLCRELLAKHDYASKAEAKLSTVFLYEYADPGLGLREQIPVGLTIRSSVSKGDGRVYRRVCVEAVGMTVCPCALQVCGHILSTSGYAPSHTQRARLKLCVHIHNDTVDIADLVDIALRSFSAPVFSYLKRERECKLILRGFENAKFAEDVVRDVLYNVYSRLGGRLPRSATVYVSLRSYESVHPFDLYVKTACRVEDLYKHFGAKVPT